MHSSYYRGCWHELSLCFLLGSVKISSPMTAVYNPKAFIQHSASLGHTCVHCQRFSTAAIRRCLGSVSVPVRRIMLSHPLPIVALVSRYLTNKLIGRRLIPERNSLVRRRYPVLPPVSQRYPRLRGRFLRITLPFAAVHTSKLVLLARLACLIHAANVHSEPGSNPSIVYAYYPAANCRIDG